VDSGCGMRLRRPVTAEAYRDHLGALSGSVGRDVRCSGLPPRRIRAVASPRDDTRSPRASTLAASSGLEALDIDASSRRRRLSPRPPPEDDGNHRGRAFFDQVTRADQYAELIGRPRIASPSPRSLLEELSIAELQALEGDADKTGLEDDVSTSASDDAHGSRKMAPEAPSIKVRRMMQSLLPQKGGPEIPLEVVARLETLVSLADRVESGRRQLRKERELLDCASLMSPGPRPGTPPEVDAAELVAAGARQVAAPWPTLLRPTVNEPGSKHPCPDAGKVSPAPQTPPRTPEQCSEFEASTASTVSTKERMQAQRRKGFNLVRQGGGRGGWEMIK